MRLLDTLEIASVSLKRNVFRSFLTTLGIIIGVASVIATLAVGQGSSDLINEQIGSLGSNVLLVVPGSLKQGGVRVEAGAAAKLDEEDATEIKEECALVKFVSPLVRVGARLNNAGENWTTTVYGVNPEYLEIREWAVENGADFTPADLQGTKKTCLLGKTVAENLFGVEANPVGMEIRVANLAFTVVGVLERKGQNPMGQDQDDVILMPYATAQRKLSGTPYATAILVSTFDMESVEDAVAQIKDALLSAKGRQGRLEMDFSIRTQEEISEAAHTAANVLSLLLAAVAMISLLVGGIGIMNIMMVSVKERTREIGLRMAIGAKPNDVLAQFLMEALILSLLGGLLGLGLGCALPIALYFWKGWPLVVSPASLLTGLGSSIATGLFFGWFPARLASKMNPIDALKYE